MTRPATSRMTAAAIACERPLFRGVMPALLLARSARISCRLAHLVAVGGEILRREPGFEGSVEHRPFAVDHREPGRIAIARLESICWRKTPSKLKPRRFAVFLLASLRIVAFPLVAAVAEILEGRAWPSGNAPRSTAANAPSRSHAPHRRPRRRHWPGRRACNWPCRRYRRWRCRRRFGDPAGPFARPSSQLAKSSMPEKSSCAK